MLINGLTYGYYKDLVYKFLLYPEAWQVYIFGKDMEALKILADIAIEIGGDLICSKNKGEKYIQLISKTGGQLRLFYNRQVDNMCGQRAHTVIADDLYSLKDFEEYFYPLANLSMWDVNYFNSDEVKECFKKDFEKDKKINIFYKDWKESLNENNKSD